MPKCVILHIHLLIIASFSLMSTFFQPFCTIFFEGSGKMEGARAPKLIASSSQLHRFPSFHPFISLIGRTFNRFLLLFSIPHSIPAHSTSAEMVGRPSKSLGIFPQRGCCLNGLVFLLLLLKIFS